jgi:demethylmenaquinone methyltransferase/2-methoxy-6-polyprenyl-1,4-benzoquinol methylase
VRGVFDSVATNYDLMNDLMSGGAHRLWKEFTLSLTGLHTGSARSTSPGGTGDLATGLAKQVGKSGMVILSDINAAMLGEGPRPHARRRPGRQRESACSPMPRSCRSPTRNSTA